jgi:hypothetical protein
LQDRLLEPLPFRGGVGVGLVRRRGRGGATSPTPDPSPEGEGLLSAGSRIDEAFGELEGLFERVGQARFDAFADDDAVDHDLDVVLVLLVERRGRPRYRGRCRRCGRG